MSEPQFQSFDTVEEMLQWMAVQTDSANAHLHPLQAQVTWGSHWVRFYDVPGRILIFGKVMTQDEMAAAESVVHEGEDPAEVAAEAEATIAAMHHNHERGYLFGYAYSVIEPDGEPGDTHRANLWPISEHVFNDAKANGWRMDDLGPTSRQAIADTYAVARAHQMSSTDG